MLDTINGLEGYMSRYGSLLAEQAQRSLKPLHTPGLHPPAQVDALRSPFEAQAHVIAANTKSLRHNKSLTICGECGVGKTLVGMLSAHHHAGGRPYRALVFGPPHLVGKWQREITETIPGATATIIDDYRQVTRHPWRTTKPTGPEWWIISNNRAKLGSKWKPSYATRVKPAGVAYCHDCDWPVMKKESQTQELVPLPLEDLEKRRHFCENCHSALWTYTHEIDRWPVATYIHKHLKGVFKYLIVDEVHEEKGEDTAQANAMGSLAAACRYTIAMTGTLIGGYADHMRTMLFRLSPTSLVGEGFGWSDRMPFNERYGRIERKTTERESKSGKTNRQSRGSSGRTVKYVRPGIMPTFFGRHLMGNTVFLGLEEVADNLPLLTEEVLPVDMDREQAEAYSEVEELLTQALKEMVAKGDKRLLGAMLQTLLGYCDRPYGWGEIGYYQIDEDSGAKTWQHVVTPAELDAQKQRPKEEELLRHVVAEKALGRKSWVFTTMTDKRDVTERLKDLLTACGVRTTILRANVETRKREAWIAENGPKYDCIISHPQLIQTGIDLFDKKGGHNFPTLVWYLTGYNLFTMRQASRRAWRIGQQADCKVLYLYYEGTMQARAMTLMGTKLTAAEAIEGKFSADGLAAMAGSEGSMEMALARSLVNNLDDLDAARVWTKVGAKPRPVVPVTPEPAIVVPEMHHRPLRSSKRRRVVAPVATRQLSLFDDLAVA